MLLLRKREDFMKLGEKVRGRSAAIREIDQAVEAAASVAVSNR